MKRKVKKLLLSLPCFEMLCRWLTRRHVRTLMYHRFAKPDQSDSFCISGETLRDHLAYIKRYHSCWSPDDHWAAIKGQREWESCPVVLTVDDGYRDFFEVAFPVLREAGMPAMVFVTTGFVDGRLLLWWDRLEQLLGYGCGQVLTVELDGAVLQLDLTTKSCRKQVWHLIADRCRFLPHTEKEALIEKLAIALDAVAADLQDARFRGLSWSEIKQMSQSNIQFGAHTVSHPILSRLQEQAVQTEIVQSRQQLSAVLQCPVDWFCYPQGGPADYTPGIKDMARDAGFKGCYVAHQSIEQENDFFALPRYCAGSDMVDFRWSLCGAEYLFLKCRTLLGRPARPGHAYWAGSEPLASTALATASLPQAGFMKNQKSCSEN